MKGATLISLFAAIALVWEVAGAHEPHDCPPGFPDTPALSGHIEPADTARGPLNFQRLFDAGEERFLAL
jgi:hypothetical protein